MFIGFPRTRWPWRQFSKNYAAWISVKISRICEFRAVMGTMTGLLGYCSSNTLRSRVNDYCLIRPAPSGAGRTTPSQPGQYFLNGFWKREKYKSNKWFRVKKVEYSFKICYLHRNVNIINLFVFVAEVNLMSVVVTIVYFKFVIEMSMFVVLQNGLKWSSLLRVFILFQGEIH